MITLDDKTVKLLKTLYSQIEGESDKPAADYNVDLVTRNQYMIMDILRERLSPTVPVITIKVPLYTEDDEGNIKPFSEDEVYEAVQDIRNMPSIEGYVFDVIGVAQERYFEDSEEVAQI